MNAFSGRTALITGGSRGIGLELAKLCAAEGANIVLVSRDRKALDDAVSAIKETEPKALVIPFVKDLSTPGAGRELWEEMLSQGVPIHILINNAGFGMLGYYPALDAEREAQMLQLNMISLAELTRFAVKDMLERKWGRILNIGSTAAFQSVPYFAAYAASKAFVLSYTEALAEEVRGTGVSVTCLCPGPTETGFFDAANMRPSRQMGMLTPDVVAKKGMEALLKGKSLVIPGFINKMVASASRFSLRSMVTKFAGKSMKSQMGK